MPYYSFVILCHNQWNLTQQAITTLNQSISDSHKARGIELVVINNGSNDETKVELEKLKGQVKEEMEIVTVHLEENRGFLIALNLGFSRCRGEIITILNNDLIFPEGWFDGIVDTLEKDATIGAAVPHLSYASGEANVGVRFQSVEEMKKFSKEFMEANKEKVVFTERVIGACVSIKRDLFQAIGGNDFWYGFGFFDDDDWSLRACIAGYKIAIVGASFVDHIGNVTFHQHSENVAAAIHSNGEKFAKKWDVVAGFDRRKLVDGIAYSKELHYYPVKKVDFISPIVDEKVDPNGQSYLLVADWNNERSKWKERLNEIKELVLNEDKQLHIWIPELYYYGPDITHEVKKIVGEAPALRYIYEQVPPIEVIRFLSKYDYFITVNNDFVNLYLRGLVDEVMEFI